MKRIYLDHTATTPVDGRVLEAMQPYFAETFGNASSIHAYGRDAKMALERARATIAGVIGAQSSELFFTSGGTEADNQAILGAALAGRKRGKNHVITTAAEHHAVLEPCEALRELGFDVTVLPVDEYGAISSAQVAAAMTDKTALVSTMHANNEVGTITALKEITVAAQQYDAVVHTDAVQTLCKIPVRVDDLGVDLMTISAHKLYGPKGIGGLYVRRGTELEPLLYGGGQERGKRPGTENVPLAVGFAKAVELVYGEMQNEMRRLELLRNSLESRIREEFPSVIVNGHPQYRLPHILNISFDSKKIALEGEMLVMNMDLEGIAVSSGSACTSGSVQPSHVLLAIGRDMDTAKASLRFAFGKSNHQEDVELVLHSLGRIVRRMTT